MASPTQPPPAVCLLSGGMDSAVVLAEARAAGRRPVALSFLYGQRHGVELEAARRVARAQGVADHRLVAIDLASLASSSLTGRGEVEKDRDQARIGSDVPSTYVPARNTVFLALALGLAESIGAEELWIGVNAIDYSGYPDCRPEFLAAFERLANLATAAGTERGQRFRVRAPLLQLDKAAIVLRAEALGVDLGLTHTCYDPHSGPAGALACGRCDACRLRLAGFAAAGRQDPLPYADRPAQRSPR
jgi:7-cyano-7-deazaguanine synthase